MRERITGILSCTYFPHLATTECADFQVDAAVYMRDHENARGLFEWARGHAKSTHISLLQPLWLKIQPNAQPLIMILVSKSQEAARRLLGDLQAELESNDLYNADFGNQRGAGIWTNGEFTTATGDLFIALGRGQSPRGIKKRGCGPIISRWTTSTTTSWCAIPGAWAKRWTGC